MFQQSVSGLLNGLNTVMSSLFVNFSPGDQGITLLDDQMTVNLAVPSALEWGWVDEGVTSSIAGGSNSGVNLIVIPRDERSFLLSASVTRVSGDNLAHLLRIYQPPGYGLGLRMLTLVNATVPVIDLSWPPFDQPMHRHGPLTGPILLEPGAIVEFVPSGAGAGASVFNYEILQTRTKIVRARQPT